MGRNLDDEVPVPSATLPSLFLAWIIAQAENGSRMALQSVKIKTDYLKFTTHLFGKHSEKIKEKYCRKYSAEKKHKNKTTKWN